MKIIGKAQNGKFLAEVTSGELSMLMGRNPNNLQYGDMRDMPPALQPFAKMLRERDQIIGAEIPIDAMYESANAMMEGLNKALPLHKAVEWLETAVQLIEKITDTYGDVRVKAAHPDEFGAA